MYRRILIVDNIDGPVPVHPGRIGGGGDAGHLVKLTAEIVDALIAQPLCDLTHIQIGAEHKFLCSRDFPIVDIAVGTQAHLPLEIGAEVVFAVSELLRQP